MLPIDPDHLPAVITTLRADGVAYLNIGSIVVEGDDPFAPAEWRALADAVCEKCDGTGDVPFDDGPMPWVKPCPDCRGTGKPIHTLTAECETCLGDGEWPIVLDDGSWDKEPCPDCVRVVVAELVSTDELVERNWDAHNARTALITPLGPPLQPGDWVAVLRKVER